MRMGWEWNGMYMGKAFQLQIKQLDIYIIEIRSILLTFLFVFLNHSYIQS